jgi:hypothetical protein
LIAAALAVSIGLIRARAVADTGKVEKAKVNFTEPLKLKDVILKGQYLFVHDEEKMARGEDCTYVYDQAGKLIVSFHCEPVARDKAAQFKVIVTQTGISGISEIEEYQFAGSTEGHRVPKHE